MHIDLFINKAMKRFNQKRQRRDGGGGGRKEVKKEGGGRRKGRRGQNEKEMKMETLRPFLVR